MRSCVHGLICAPIILFLSLLWLFFISLTFGGSSTPDVWLVGWLVPHTDMQRLLLVLGCSLPLILILVRLLDEDDPHPDP